MISIIIPIYNAEPNLKRCINSILAQTTSDWELILINDGSIDRSLAICNEYVSEDSRIKLVNQQNRGVSCARNKGIEAAHGEYITFIDADDVIEPTYLKELYDSLGYDMVVTGFFYDDIPKIPQIRNMELSTKEDIIANLSEYLSTDFFCFPWGRMFKSSIIKNANIKFDEKLRFGEDHVFNWTYIKHTNSIKIIPKAFYHKMVENESGIGYKNLKFEEIDYLDNRLFHIKDELEKKYNIKLNLAPQCFFHIPFMKNSITYRKLSFYINYYKIYHPDSKDSEIYEHIAKFLYHPALINVKNNLLAIEDLDTFIDKPINLFYYAKIKSKIMIPFIKMHLYHFVKYIISKI